MYFWASWGGGLLLSSTPGYTPVSISHENYKTYTLQYIGRLHYKSYYCHNHPLFLDPRNGSPSATNVVLLGVVVIRFSIP